MGKGLNLRTGRDPEKPTAATRHYQPSECGLRVVDGGVDAARQRLDDIALSERLPLTNPAAQLRMVNVDPLRQHPNQHALTGCRRMCAVDPYLVEVPLLVSWSLRGGWRSTGDDQ